MYMIRGRVSLSIKKARKNGYLRVSGFRTNKIWQVEGYVISVISFKKCHLGST